jgi:hypothetical protein
LRWAWRRVAEGLVAPSFAPQWRLAVGAVLAAAVAWWIVSE